MTMQMQMQMQMLIRTKVRMEMQVEMQAIHTSSWSKSREISAETIGGLDVPTPQEHTANIEHDDEILAGMGDAAGAAREHGDHRVVRDGRGDVDEEPRPQVVGRDL